MITAFVEAWESRKHLLREALEKKHPEDYDDLVKGVVEVVSPHDSFGPDPGRIVKINHGSYSGTLIFVIAERGYSPNRYWYVFVDYGSCSGCDALEGIRGHKDGPPSAKQVDEYMTLALHIVQRMKPLVEE